MTAEEVNKGGAGTAPQVAAEKPEADDIPPPVEPRLLKELIGEEQAAKIAADGKKDVNDIYMVPPSLHDFLGVARNPEHMMDPALLLHIMVKTKDRKRVINSDAVKNQDGEHYQEAYVHAVAYYEQFGKRHGAIAKKVMPHREQDES